MDPGCSPGWILSNHATNQITISASTAGRPPRLLRDFQRQYLRKPSRCHRTTVSGLTMINDSRHRGHNRCSSIQRMRSGARSLGRGFLDLSTASCWRSAMLSRARSSLGLSRARIITARKAMRVIAGEIAALEGQLARRLQISGCSCVFHWDQADEVLANHRKKEGGAACATPPPVGCFACHASPRRCLASCVAGDEGNPICWIARC